MMNNQSKTQLSYFPKINSDRANICLILLLWVLMIILVNPIGNFPLNDDWAYGWSVKTLLETGDFQLSDWTATNLLPQVGLGAIFCLPFGFTFTALRFLSLASGLLGVLVTYGLLREVKTNAKLSLFGAFVVALNPIYFQLSNSFSSDIPSFAFFVLSFYFLIRGLRDDSKPSILVGLIISFISILNRQSGLLVLPAFGLAYLVKKGLKFQTIIEALSPTILGIVVHVSYSRWLEITDRKPALYSFQIEKLLENFSKGFFNIISTYTENLLIIVIYLGLFLFPFLIIQFSNQFKNLPAWQRRILNFLLVFFVVVMGLNLRAKGQQMPLIGNIMNPFDLGPQTLKGYNSFLDWNSGVLINRIWKVLTWIGLIGAVLLFQYCLLAILQLFSRDRTEKLGSNHLIPLIICASTAFLYLLPIAGLDKQFWFDRYLIVLLPLLMVFVSILSIANRGKRTLGFWTASLSLLMMVFYGGFTISTTHDYLSWNRLRWQALGSLIQDDKIPLSDINGGFEFNGWYFGNRLETCSSKYQQNSGQTRFDWGDFTCLWDNGKNFTVSFVPQAGYQIQKQYSFRRWLPWREEKLYVLKKLG